jgi:TRAP-type C4-dicarboxylate transport system permease small subunit
MFIDSSRDILNIVIAFCILWFTVFLCWMMYYFISMLRNANAMVKSVKDKMEMVDKILKLVKDKLETGSSHLAMLSDTALKIAGFVMDKQAGKSKRRKRK